jgi:hypothetical protein
MRKTLEMEVSGLKDGSRMKTASTSSPLARLSQEEQQDPKLKELLEKLEKDRFESTEEGKMVKSKLALTKALAVMISPLGF